MKQGQPSSIFWPKKSWTFNMEVRNIHGSRMRKWRECTTTPPIILTYLIILAVRPWLLRIKTFVGNSCLGVTIKQDSWPNSKKPTMICITIWVFRCEIHLSLFLTLCSLFIMPISTISLSWELEWSHPWIRLMNQSIVSLSKSSPGELIRAEVQGITMFEKFSKFSHIMASWITLATILFFNG